MFFKINLIIAFSFLLDQIFPLELLISHREFISLISHDVFKTITIFPYFLLVSIIYFVYEKEYNLTPTKIQQLFLLIANLLYIGYLYHILFLKIPLFISQNVNVFTILIFSKGYTSWEFTKELSFFMLLITLFCYLISLNPYSDKLNNSSW